SRQLQISCGCALFNARVALAAAGYASAVRHFPDPTRSTLLAQLSVTDLPPDPELGGLDSVVELRHTNRRPFAEHQVPAGAGEALQRALLELTRHGYVAELMSEVAEMPPIRAMLCRELGLTGAPHLLLRVGRAPATPATRRRRLVEVLVEHL